MNKLLTLCIIQKEGRVLLGMKKQGFGAGRWNGFGGKVEEGETIEAAAVRETMEESGITVISFDKVAVIEFEFYNIPRVHEVHAFLVTEFTGEPIESDEMKPQWFGVKEVPYDSMWPDDKHWLPHLLEGKKLRGRFKLGEGDAIVEHHLQEI
ncbi:MAG: 8-oxo-dGTP diphosphatase [Patescibacteria group bacterium]